MVPFALNKRTLFLLGVWFNVGSIRRFEVCGVFLNVGIIIDKVFAAGLQKKVRYRSCCKPGRRKIQLLTTLGRRSTFKNTEAYISIGCF